MLMRRVIFLVASLVLLCSLDMRADEARLLRFPSVGGDKILMPVTSTLFQLMAEKLKSLLHILDMRPFQGFHQMARPLLLQASMMAIQRFTLFRQRAVFLSV